MWHSKIRLGDRAGFGSSSNVSTSDELGNSLLLPVPGTMVRSQVASHYKAPEFLYSFVVHGHLLKITSTSWDLARRSKHVLNEFFLGDSRSATESELCNFETKPCSSMAPQGDEQFEGDALSSGTATPVVLEPEPEFEYKPLRRPNIRGRNPQEPAGVPAGLSLSDAASQTDALPQGDGRLVYDTSELVRISMSPQCLTTPDNWAHISMEYPAIVRSRVNGTANNKYKYQYNYQYNY